MATWNKVTASDAEQNPLFGFGGWMYAFYAYAIVEFLLPMIGLFGDGRGLINMYGAENLSLMRIVMAVNLLLPLPFLILAPLKNPWMPALTIIAFWISPVVFLAAMTIGGLGPLKILWVVSPNTLVAAAYTWYLLQSKRVNVTYRHRVPG